MVMEEPEDSAEPNVPIQAVRYELNTTKKDDLYLELW